MSPRFAPTRSQRSLDLPPSARRITFSGFKSRCDRIGGSPLHRAVMGSARKVVELLLDRGADIHAFHSTSRGGGGGWWSTRVQAIDLAIWGWNNLAPSKRDSKPPGCWYRAEPGCSILTVASALGDIGPRPRQSSMKIQSAIRPARANGRRPLTAAVRFGHHTIVPSAASTRGARDPRNGRGVWRGKRRFATHRRRRTRRSRPRPVTARSWRGSQQRCRLGRQRDVGCIAGAASAAHGARRQTRS